MIAKIAVSAANFAIDKPYSYFVPENVKVQPGIRVTVPFGRGNRTCEGVVLSVEEGSAENLKSVTQVLDEAPLLSGTMLRLAAVRSLRIFFRIFRERRLFAAALSLLGKRKTTHGLFCLTLPLLKMTH